MKTHTLTVRDRRLSWDDRRLTRDSVAVDEVAVDMDEEYRGCDTVVAVMVSAAHQDPVRMVVEGGRYRIPSEFTRHTGSILTCLIGYVGEVQRVTSEQESQPLVVTKSGPVGGTDPADEQPDLWRQLMEAVEESKRIAQSVRDDADAGRFDGDDGAPGAPGKPGDKGDPGADGYSPSAKVEQTAEGATVSITDKDGTTTATIRNGAKGDPGDKGDPGADGTSPTASVERTDNGVRVTVTDVNGTTTAEVLDGRDGETVIPDLGVTNVKIADNAVNTRTIADGAVTRAKLAQDALVKAGAGISIADDGTAAVDMDGLRNMMQVTNQRIGIPVDGVSTGSVYYSFTPFMMTVVGRDGFTVQKPADETSNYVRFMRLDTDIAFKNAVPRIDAALIKESTTVSQFVGYSIDTDGTAWLEMYLTDNDKHTFTMNAFSNIIIPLCGGGSLVTNLWQRTTEGTKGGLTWTILDDGTVTCNGAPTSTWCNVFSANVSISTFGMHPGRTYSLDSGVKDIQTSAMLNFYGSDGAKVGEQFNSGTFVLPTGTDNIQCVLYVQDMVGRQIDLTFKPMLVEGAPADYVPYALGGHVLENLWRCGNPTATENLRFDLLDDGGLSVYYDGVDPNRKWSNILWRGTLEDAGMRVGETYYLAEFGTAAVVNVNVRFLDADSVIIPNQPSAFERAITAPEGAVYVEMYVSLSGEQKPQRFTSYPMLVRGTKRPAAFVQPKRGDNAV